MVLLKRGLEVKMKRKIDTMIFLIVCLAGSLLNGSSSMTSPEQAPRGRNIIEFSTNEGTWMSLDVSPDGASIVFDLFGDLYILPMGGGNANLLTQGPSWDTQPRYSPDGRSIVYVCDRDGGDNLWLVAAEGGSPKQITHENKYVIGSPAWSPDGKAIVARKGNGSLFFDTLWLFYTDGGEGNLLFNEPGAFNGIYGPTFSPDGKNIVFATRSSEPSVFMTTDIVRTQIKRIDISTGEIKTLTTGFGGGVRPLMSPDGRFLIYGTRYDGKTGLRMKNVTTGEESWLVYPVDLDQQEYGSGDDLLPCYAFTPDGGSIIVSFQGKIHKIDIATKKIQDIPFIAQVRQEVSPRASFTRRIEQGQIQVKQIRNAHPSPDGKWLVFNALGKLWTMDLPEGKPRRLTTAAVREYAPCISPDGEWIAYVSWSDEKGGMLWKTAREGGSPVPLSKIPALYQAPSWSADGSKIVFVMGSAYAWLQDDHYDQQQICWVSAKGGEIQKIINSPLPSPGVLDKPPQQPTFNDDGSRVFFLDFQLPSPNYFFSHQVLTLKSVGLDGASPRTHVKIDAGRTAVISSNGEWIAWTAEGDVYLAPMPRTSEVLTLGRFSSSVPVKRLTNEGGYDIHWLNGNRALCWGFANHVYNMELSLALRGNPVKTVDPPVYSIDLKLPRPCPRGKIALKNGRIIPMRGDEVISSGTIIIENNRIIALGPADTIAIPSDATIMDLAGKTVMPGIVDVHAHPHPWREIFPEKYATFAAHLAYGITTMFDPDGFDNNSTFGTAELLEAGELVGPRYFGTGQSLRPSAITIESLDDARHIARRYKKQGAIALKEYLQARRVVRQWIATAAREEGLNTTAEGAGYFAGQMTHILDGYTGFEHWIPATPLSRDVVEMMAQSGTSYALTLGVAFGAMQGQFFFRRQMNLHDDPKMRRFVNTKLLDRFARRGFTAAEDEFLFWGPAKGAAAITHRGGNVTVGGHENKGLPTHWEIWMYVLGGMTPLEALRAATAKGAETLGMADDIGSLAIGKLADLVVLNSNPLEDIQNSADIFYIMKNGELYDGQTLDRLWPEKKTFGKFIWETEDETLRKIRNDRQ